MYTNIICLCLCHIERTRPLLPLGKRGEYGWAGVDDRIKQSLADALLHLEGYFLVCQQTDFMCNDFALV